MNENSERELLERKSEEGTEVGDDDIERCVCVYYMYICARECLRYTAGRQERKGWHEDFSVESRRKKRFAVRTPRERITGEGQKERRGWGEATYNDREYLKSG